MVINNKATAGFTLIEVMIVVVIVAILAAIALPSYQNYIQKSRRVDARETLMRIATLQERHFFQNSAYSADEGKFGGTTSPEGWYTISVTCSTTACNDFTATATATGAQAKDTQCAVFSINQTLKQSAAKQGGGDTSDICWK